MLELTYLGRHWPYSGDLSYLTHPNGEQARIYVDSLGETWVDIRRIPTGGWFHTERVESYRALNGANDAELDLRRRGFGSKEVAAFAHRVREAGI